jgi:hypothetical protein
VRADLIATMVRDGDFRTVQRGLTVHIRERAADGAQSEDRLAAATIVRQP